AAYGVIMTLILEPRLIPHFLNKLTQLPI
ncbi:MAG: rhomboid family intramembrane serine protease, partial [Acinetobacter sp.]|nr:rhomboid family intramembrane serine protease [Acinetobacter sp.]